MTRRFNPLFMLAALAAVAPSTAFAQEVVVTPFLPKAGLDQKVANNMTSLVSSELDFMSQYDSAEQMETKPKSLTISCLNKASCLKAIGKSAGSDFIVAGSVAPAGDEYEVYMVLLDVNTGKYVRKQTVKVDASPGGMADGMGAHCAQLVTGAGQGKEQDAQVDIDDFDMFGDDDEFGFEDEEPDNNRLGSPGNSGRSLDDFEDEPDDWELQQQREAAEREARAEERRRAEERAEAERRAKEEAAAERRRREEQAQREREEQERQAREDARRRQEEEDRAADARRRREEEDAEARRRERALADAEPDIDDISFGSVDADEIEVQIDDIQFGDASTDIELVDDRERIDFDSLDDLDDPTGSEARYSDRNSGRDSSSRNSSRNGGGSSSRDYSSGSSSRDRDGRDRDSYTSLDGPSSEVTIRGERGTNDPRFGVTMRAGYSQFQIFEFVTWGAELSIPVGDVFFLSLGLEGYSTQRTIPPALQEPDGPAEEWNTIAPFNFGVKYQPTTRPFRPYIGGDLTITPYTFVKFRMAPGLRARGGFDYMVSDAFGLNLNLSAGFWYGSEFELIQKDLVPLGGVPALSLGTTILF